jgi:hypothetical protein
MANKSSRPELAVSFSSDDTFGDIIPADLAGSSAAYDHELSAMPSQLLFATSIPSTLSFAVTTVPAAVTTPAAVEPHAAMTSVTAVTTELAAVTTSVAKESGPAMTIASAITTGSVASVINFPFNNSSHPGVQLIIIEFCFNCNKCKGVWKMESLLRIGRSTEFVYI